MSFWEKIKWYNRYSGMSGTRFSAFCLKGAFFMPIKAKSLYDISKIFFKGG